MGNTAESYVLFELAGTLYGLPSDNVLHIDMFEHVTLVPNANPAIDGVVFSRGQVIPALNLRSRFGLPRVPATLRTRIIVVTTQGRTVGLIVDAAREFRKFSNETVCPIEKTLTGINGKYLRAVVQTNDRLVLIPDLKAILTMEDAQLPEAPEALAPAATTS
jgi:chemotaxis signal transduction protein